MGRTGRVRVAGPLAALAERFGAELEWLGYSRFTAEAQLQLMAHVSGWLEGRGLDAGQLTTARLQEYLAHRRACGHVHRLSPRGLAPLLVDLRGLGVARRDPVAGDFGERSTACGVRGAPALRSRAGGQNRGGLPSGGPRVPGQPLRARGE
jgi:hypothetical protein